jgi:hypothetical protein
MSYLHKPIATTATAKQVNKPLPPLPTCATRTLHLIKHVWHLVKAMATAAAAAATPAKEEEGRTSYESWITESFHTEVSKEPSI